ncbi:MAG: hypothetical protein WAX04_14375 [Oscillospiraceae bacterium]
MMKVINPLFRRQDNDQTAAYGCNCVCNEASANHDDGRKKAWWWGGSDCGCTCNSTSANNVANTNKAAAM